jgi:subtilisin family serine protease
MDRKHLGIIASALVLVVSMLWLTQGDDEGAQAASSSRVAIPAAGSSTASANPSATPGKNGNSYTGTQQSGRYASPLAQADQARSSATPAARNNANSSNTQSGNTPFASPIQTRPKVKPAPLEPRAEPYALMVNSGSVTVRFSVRVTGDADPSTTVYLRQSGAEGAITMNDLGVDGDIAARDNIHGANIVLDTSRLQPDTCLSYIATLRDGESETVSSPLNVCVSNLPVRAAASNTDKPVAFADGFKAVADEILVTAQPGTKIAAMQALAASINATIVGSIPPLNLYQLKLPAPVSETQLTVLVAQMRVRPNVKAVSVNAIGQPAAAPNDPEYVNQHGLQLARAQDIWDIGANGTGIIVAVLDTGIDRSHPDFGTTGDCQLIDNDCGLTSTDFDLTNGHGTAVAGVIAAKTNNLLGVAGIAPSSKIKPILVGADTTYTLAEIIQAFLDASAYGVASVINASLTIGPLLPFDFAPPTLDVGNLCASVNSAVFNGATPVAIVVNAAGNNGSNGNYYPGRCNDSTHVLHDQLSASNKKYFITVANSISTLPIDPACANASALDQRCGGTTTNVLNTSNYGAWVDITAPGMSIQTIRSSAIGGGYASYTGTSFSAPMVSGAAAILLQCGVPLNQIETTLRTSANVTVPFPDGSSAPRLDIYRALAQVNHSPTAVGLTNSSLNENIDTSAGVDVGTLVATDLDTCDKYTYSIAGGADAASFSIDNATNTLRLSAGVLNFEAKASYAVTVRVTDYFGAFFDQALTVTVSNVNEAPSIGNQSFSVNEGTANGSTVGTVSASDPDAGDTKTFSITAGNTSSAFAISPTTGVITVNNSAALVFATNPSFSLTVRVTDAGGLFASATVTVNVNSVAATNHAPSISAQTFSVSESSGNGTSLGTVLASDPDAGDSLSYSITAGNTGGAFALSTTTGALTVGNSSALSYATTPSYALTVQVTDTGSLSASATMTVNVSAASAPAPTPTPTPPPAAPPASSGGGGGCSVMPAGSDPDFSLLLVMMVVLGYGLRRRQAIGAKCTDSLYLSYRKQPILQSIQNLTRSIGA